MPDPTKLQKEQELLKSFSDHLSDEITGTLNVGLP